MDAVHGFRFASYNPDSAYQPKMPGTQTAGGAYPNGFGVKQIPLGMGNPESIFKTGGPQGGSMEPGNLRSYALEVLFEGGKVAHIKATENIN